MTKRFTRDLQSLLQYIYIYNYLIINILYIYYIMFVTCKLCKRKKLIKSFFTKTDSNGFKTSFTIYNLQNLTSSFYKFGVLKYLNIFVKNFKTYNYKKSRQQTDNLCQYLNQLPDKVKTILLVAAYLH